MKIVAIIGISILLLILILLDVPAIRHAPKKEKRAFATLWSLGWVLAVLLILHPELKGPTQWLQALFKPLL